MIIWLFKKSLSGYDTRSTPYFFVEVCLTMHSKCITLWPWYGINQFQPHCILFFKNRQWDTGIQKTIYTLLIKFHGENKLAFFVQADLLRETEDVFLCNLALVIQPAVYLRNQFVQRSGEIGSFMCYIHHGTVEVWFVILSKVFFYGCTSMSFFEIKHWAAIFMRLFAAPQLASWLC